jgi:hypothetical protein
MGFYQDQILPLLINWSMRQRDLAAYRSRIIPAAEGRMLEIGMTACPIFTCGASGPGHLAAVISLVIYGPRAPGHYKRAAALDYIFLTTMRLASHGLLR